MIEPRFGRIAAELTSTDDFLSAEESAGKRDMFSPISPLFNEAVWASLQGDEFVEVERSKREDAISVRASPTFEATLADTYSVEAQQRRGAWYLPDKVSIKVGWINFAHLFLREPRYAAGLATETRARVVLADCPAAVFAWSLLEPLFERLYLPFELRGGLSGKRSPEEQLQAWDSADQLYGAIGLDLGKPMAAMRYGGGWSRMSSAQQLEAKAELVRTIREQASPATAERYRAHQLMTLVQRYYDKAKDGRGKRRQVATRDLQRVLSGYFGGDWLKFVAYLDEEPHPEEIITTALPEARLFVGGAKTADVVASETGMPLTEIQRVIGTYWSADDPQVRGVLSPLQQRVNVLRDLWSQFDSIHKRQTPGMPSLWGLVEENRSIRLGWQGPKWYEPAQYKKLLVAPLIADIERLWGTVMLPRWPDRVVSEISPHALMAEALGPALRFWHGCALTAWFVCEGPSSRTDISGIRGYHQEDLSQLEQLGCPVPSALFDDLQRAEHQLGPPEPIQQSTTSELAAGLSFTLSFSQGQRRSGFQHVRRVIDQHREAWGKTHLEPYLRARWESELTDAAREFAEFIAEKGKTPTAKQFAKFAEQATNHWFGGDFNNLYAALGEKSPVRPVRVSLMPSDRLGYGATVFRLLGGNRRERERVVENREAAREQNDEIDRQNKLSWLAEQALRFTQLEEALGQEPGLKEFGQAGFEHRSSAIAPDVRVAWDSYRSAVVGARSLPPTEVAAVKTPVPRTRLETTSEPPKTQQPRSLFGRLFGR